MRWKKKEQRDDTFSDWHRHVLGDDMKMLDIDCLEFCRWCDEPLALIETARDVGRDDKNAIVMKRLAIAAGTPAWCLLYTFEEHECTGHGPCQDPSCGHGIASFRKRQVWSPTWGDDYKRFERFRRCAPRDVVDLIIYVHVDHEINRCTDPRSAGYARVAS